MIVTFEPSGRTADVPEGTTVFAAVRSAGLPLGSSCDGDALCGFCRVQILAGAEHLSPPDPSEAALLTRKRSEPDERIACVARILGPVVVTASYW
ncbi:MAG: (2Fe-2S)-binding protein [Myxococcales bacterium]|nr:(2Fe-2S)-binding protein [Myxococcales bacterium]